MTSYAVTVKTRVSACRTIDRLMELYGDARDMEITLLTAGESHLSRKVDLYVVQARNYMDEIGHQCGRLRAAGMWSHADDLRQEAFALRDMHDKKRAAVLKERRK